MGINIRGPISHQDFMMPVTDSTERLSTAFSKLFKANMTTLFGDGQTGP
jgi:hypothetical protein